MNDDEVLNELFQRAILAIDSGDIATLDSLLAAHPALVQKRLETPGDWLRSQVGNALDTFFQRPYLLWFVAEDPVRTGKPHENIAESTQAILQAIDREQVESRQEQLDYALQLVCYSWIARECDVQIPLIDVLMDAGANPEGCPNNALINGNLAAARHLVERGAPMTLAVALCLEDWESAESLAATANLSTKQFALVLAALHGNPSAVARALTLGAEVNLPCEDLYPHGSPLHHAVCSGSLEAVKVLVEAGADKAAKDTAYNGTPVGWAKHSLEGQKTPEDQGRFEAIIRYLS